MNVQIVTGDLLEQDVEVIVNAWNRNIIPWWLLLPQGVSGAIKRKGGIRPFIEVGRAGPIPLGGSVKTGPGRLGVKAIIHVAAINLLWRASEFSIRESVRSAMMLVLVDRFKSVAFPVLGSGSGGYNAESALNLMKDELSKIKGEAEVKIVRFGSRADA